MAAALGKTLGGARPKKGIGGKLPSKRSINLIVTDENKISPVKAVLGIALIVVLAAVFSKYLVYDRLAEMNSANSRVNELQGQLDALKASIEDFGEIEEEYAHYTYDSMTADEMGLVERTEIVELISDIIRQQDNLFDMSVYNPRFAQLLEDMKASDSPYEGIRQFHENVATLGAELLSYREQVYSWNAASNILTVNLSGKTLENLNRIARSVEQSDFVDSCTLVTANKDANSYRALTRTSGVDGKFTVYLKQPPEPEDEEVAEP